MKPPTTIADLICKASTGRDGPGAVRATRKLVSLAEDHELERWKQAAFWRELAERWHKQDPSKRKKGDAEALARKVCSALGAREGSR